MAQNLQIIHLRLEKVKEKSYFEDLRTGGKTVLKWILEKQIGRVWTGFIWLKIGQVVGSCEHRGSIKG
jgi:hypothetical protein